MGPSSIAERYPLHNSAVFGNSVEVEFLLNSNRCNANQEDDKGLFLKLCKPIFYEKSIS